jgi:hypothetical protein
VSAPVKTPRRPAPKWVAPEAPSTKTINADDEHAARCEFQNAKLALSKLLHLAHMYDKGWLTPLRGELAEAALEANHALYLIESVIGLDKPEALREDDR